MSDPLKIPAEADAAQRRSSEPSASVWVSANAGAGKTYVLAQRVLRLLLSGVRPSSILCLTFTNAAAAEMSTRVFSRLSEIATQTDAELSATVGQLVPNVDQAIAMRRARTLFAETLETPGGLNVATIHAFAAGLLRRFPLEAEVPGAFQVLDDPTREELEDRAIAETLAEAAADPGGIVAEAIAALLPYLPDTSVRDALKGALVHREVLADMAARLGELSADALRTELEDALLPPDPGETALSDALCRDIIAADRAHGSGKQIADRLERALTLPQPEREQAWGATFLTSRGQPRALRLTKAYASVPWLQDAIGVEQDRLLALSRRKAARDCIEATVALIALADPVRVRVETAARRRGLITYDDQIELAARLVATRDAADWVRFKLDDGIDHVMLDEAQDTSPDQWALVAKLVEEYFAGSGAKALDRTLFVVGDEKQSIYSFQGAAPELFAQKRAYYERAAQGVDAEFDTVDLQHSFRSSPQVLAAVDRVFEVPMLAQSVGAPEGGVRHLAIKDRPGGVDIWPLFRNVEAAEPEEWDAPFDATPDHAGEVQLARAIVAEIRVLMDEGPDEGPPVSPGGIFVLIRKRGRFAALMNRELKSAGIPAAGADRLAVTEHIAVKDLLALARALLSPDDLSLAAVLRSPLFDMSEHALFDLAFDRTGTLMARVEERAPEIAVDLARWAAMARTLRPFDFFAQLLDGEGRRAQFAARMGVEALDALDAFLESALEFEGRGVPAMEPFLARMEHAHNELRRTVDETVDAVRVMTVHGSKGLEADVVFLADVGSQMVRGRRGSVVRPIERPSGARLLVHAPSAEATPEPVRNLLERAAAAEREEHHRLLYVAMTRARRHLVVCGAYGSRKPAEGMWHQLVADALSADCTTAGDGRLLWRHPSAVRPPTPVAEAPHPREVAEAPPWLWTKVAPAQARPASLTPSAHMDARHGPGTEARPAAAAGPLTAARYGTLVHALCEREAMDEAAMVAFVAQAEPRLSADVAGRIVGEALAALGLPQLAADEVWREVAAFGDVRLADGSVRRVNGRIDRLQRDGERLLIVDFKTDRRAPDVPQLAPRHYLEQLAAYAALMRAAVPGATVDTAIVWTAAGLFMSMDAALPSLFAVDGITT